MTTREDEAGEPSDELDRGLARMHATSPEYGGGNSNHGPMAAEALLALGHPERIESFLDGYATRLDPLPDLGREPALSGGEPSPALGDFTQMPRWRARFAEHLETGDPFAILASAWTTLASGYAAAAFHGVLRVAHAVRALEHRDNAVRRTELAHALAYWASRHVTLPGDPGARAQAGLDVEEALALVPMVPSEQRTPGGLIYRRLGVLAQFQPFARAVEAVDLDALPVDRAATALSCAAARLYLATPSARFVYLHCVTGSSALRLLLPHLSRDQQRLGVGYLFQTVAAIHATHGSGVGLPPPPEAVAADVRILRGDAAKATDDHTIKLVEAALRETAIEPRPELLAVAVTRLRQG